MSKVHPQVVSCPHVWGTHMHWEQRLLLSFDHGSSAFLLQRQSLVSQASYFPCSSFHSLWAKEPPPPPPPPRCCVTGSNVLYNWHFFMCVQNANSHYLLTQQSFVSVSACVQSLPRLWGSRGEQSHGLFPSIFQMGK